MNISQAHSLLSPPASAASPSPSTGSVRSGTPILPTPRSHRLRPGSQKEIALINYLDDRILQITRRYAKKFSNEGLKKDDTPGYTTYDEFVHDADPLVDVVWISGTRKSQSITLKVGSLCPLALLFSSRWKQRCLATPCTTSIHDLVETFAFVGPLHATRFAHILTTSISQRLSKSRTSYP